MKTIVLLLATLVLAGCGLFEPRVEYKYVNKPVLVCPSPQDLNGGEPVPEIPELEIYKLTTNSTDGEVARAYAISIKQLNGQVDVLREIVDSYDRTSAEYKKLKDVMDALYPTNSAGTIQFDEKSTNR